MSSGEKLCIYNHNSASVYEGLPHGIGGWTIVKPFFDDVEGDNTLGVNKNGLFYPLMKQRRDSYESYYDTRMSDVSNLVDDLNTELSIATIESKLESITDKILEIDNEYLDVAVDIHNLMNVEDEDLYDNYIEYLEGL